MDLDASQAGIEALKHGGNAIDAAVADQFYRSRAEDLGGDDTRAVVEMVNRIGAFPR